MIISLLALYTSFATAQADVCVSDEPPNLEFAKQAVINYYDSGKYEKDVACIAQQAIQIIKEYAPKSKNPAIVLDIDDTVLLTYDYNVGEYFGYNSQRSHIWEKKAIAPPIKPMLNMYQFARKNGVKTFFITGRKNFLKKPTEENLKRAGFYPWDGIFFRPDDYMFKSRIPYKTSVREFLTHQGYEILFSIGDQDSDLLGGFAHKTFKLPNPMYYIP